MNHMGTITIETKRLLLRKFNENDIVTSFNNWTSDEQVTKFLRWPTHKNLDTTKQIMKEWIASYDKKNFYQWAIVLKDIDEVIGTISIVDQDESLNIVTIGYCIGSKWWKQGIVTEAFKGIIPFLFDEVKVNRIQSHHDPKNIGSGKVMLKCGLTYEGTLRQIDVNNQGIVDAATYSILACEYKNK